MRTNCEFAIQKNCESEAKAKAVEKLRSESEAKSSPFCAKRIRFASQFFAIVRIRIANFEPKLKKINLKLFLDSVARVFEIKDDFFFYNKDQHFTTLVRVATCLKKRGSEKKFLKIFSKKNFFLPV